MTHDTMADEDWLTANDENILTLVWAITGLLRCVECCAILTKVMKG